MRPYTPHIPQSVGEIIDKLEWMRYHAPAFADPSFDRLYSGRDLNIVFFELRKGLDEHRQKLGETRYVSAVALTDRMEAYFHGHPNDDAGLESAGTRLIDELKGLLKQRAVRG